MRVTRWTLGVVLIVAVAVIWAGSSVLVQYVFSEQHFDKPFALTVICTSLFSVYLPLYSLGALLGLVPCPSARSRAGPRTSSCSSSASPTFPLEAHGSVQAGRDDVEAAAIVAGFSAGGMTAQSREDAGPGLGSVEENGSYEKDDVGDRAPLLGHEVEMRNGDKGEPVPPLDSLRRIAGVGLIMAPLWFGANWAYNQGLSMTSVTSSTVIASTSAVFTLLFSLMARVETFNWLQVLGVACGVAGGVMVGVSDGQGSDGPKQSVWGDVVCCAGAAGYGLYTVVLRLLCENRNVPMPLMFGFLGLFSMVTLVPTLALATVFGSAATGLTWPVFGWIVLKGLLDNVLSDYLWARGVMLTSPTVATIGLSLTIPLGFLTDAILHHLYPTALSACGGAMVVLGFVLLNLRGSSSSASH